MFGGKKQNGLLHDMAVGAAAGFVGTVAISGAIGLIQKVTGTNPMPEKEESGTEILAERVHHMVRAEPSDKSKGVLAQMIHWGYGTAWGAVYGALRNRVPGLSWGMGIPFGLAFGVLSDEVLLQLAGLAPHPKETSTKKHILGIASHGIYGLAAEKSYGAIDKAFDGRAGMFERTWNKTRKRLPLG